MKKILIILGLGLVLNACSNGGGGSTGGTPPEPKVNCVFNSFSLDQLNSINTALREELTSFKNRCSSNDLYQTLSAKLVFEILNLNNKADITSAIETNALADYLSAVFSDKSCEVKSLDTEDVQSINQCKWRQ